VAVDLVEALQQKLGGAPLQQLGSLTGACESHMQQTSLPKLCYVQHLTAGQMGNSSNAGLSSCKGYCMVSASALPAGLQIASSAGSSICRNGRIAPACSAVASIVLKNAPWTSYRRAAGGHDLLAPAVRPRQQRARRRRLRHGRQRHGPCAQRARPRAGGLPGLMQGPYCCNTGQIVSSVCVLHSSGRRTSER
jgi:hypothetical protein